jgi:sugar transferase (PEP-CTERM/EpsH1 system associated)
LRILHIVLSLKVGGLEKFVVDLCNNYPPQVYSKIACLEEVGELGKLCNSIECVSLDKKAGIDLSMINKLRTIIKKDKIQLIHTHNQGPNFYGSLSGFLCGIPVVHTKHGQNDYENKKRVILDRISSFFTNKIVCVSKDAQNICNNVIKIPRKKVTVILNGIDTEKFCPKISGKIFFDEHQLIIGNVARLAEEKDQRTLLEAAKILKEWKYNIKIVFVGDGLLRPKLEKNVRDYGLDEEVVFFGTRHDVDQIVPEFDIFVLPSTTEGISLTLLEAMSCGIPIIATDVGGNPEVVVDGQTGSLVPAKDPLAIAKKIEWLFKESVLRRKMGTLGRQRVKELFSIKKTAEQYFNLYCDILHLP